MDQTPGSPRPKSSMGIVVVLVVLVIAAIAAAMYYSKKDSDTNVDSTSQTTGTQNQTTTDSTPAVNPWQNGSVMADGTKVFVLEASNYKFTPSQIMVNKGDKVKIMINASGNTHSLVFSSGYPSVKIADTAAGKSNFVMFTADTAGTFDFYCAIGNHKALGMTGQLMVK